MRRLDRKAAGNKDPTGIVPLDRSDFKRQHPPGSAHHRPSLTSARAQLRLVTSISKSFMGQKMRRTPQIQKTTGQKRSNSTAARLPFRWATLQVTWTRSAMAFPTLSKKQTRRWAAPSHLEMAVESWAASSAADQRIAPQNGTTDEILCLSQRRGFNSSMATLMPSKYT